MEYERALEINFVAATIYWNGPGWGAWTSELDTVRNRVVRKLIRDHFQINLDSDQAHTVACSSSNILVTARAGSGKTRTVISRSAFLVRCCGVSPSQILILAFNKKAATEIKDRLDALGIDCPHVMTFHALAYAVARPEGQIIRDEPNDGDMQRSALTQRVVNDFLQMPDKEEQVRSVMSSHFRRDWDNIITGGMAMSQDDGLLFRRSFEQEAIDGTRVKSFGEKVIANFLFEHDVRYGYERNHWWGDRNYRPDFSLTSNTIVIEYFGMAGDPDYDEEMQAKREYWTRKKDWTLLEYGTHHFRDHGETGLQQALASDLVQLGVPLRKLSDDEIWRRVQDRLLTRFAQILTSLVGRCRKALLTPDALDARIRRHRCLNDTEQDVLSILSEVYTAYLDRMSAENLEDFDGLIQRAAVLIDGGDTVFDRSSGAGDLSKMRYIMVDEYQDFSPLFDLLLRAVVKQTQGKAQVFSVGDDWQAINAFAGSDLCFFNEFTQRHTPSIQLGITTNYRSARAVVDFGNQIMEGRGAQAKTRTDAPEGAVHQVDVSEFQPNTAERFAWEGDLITPAIRRLIKEPIKNGKSIAILARQRYLPFQVAKHSSGSYPKDDLGRLGVLLKHGLVDAEREQIHVGTVHQYKGREADVVILVDVVERRYPKLHPDWVFGRVFGDEPEKLIEDERRLFYVGCSRAIEQLILITEKNRVSPFLSPLQSNVEVLDAGQLESFCPEDGDWILLLGNSDGYGTEPTMGRAEILKENKYSYHGGDWPHWAKRIPKKHSVQSIVDNLHKAPWFEGPNGLAVRICSSDGTAVVSGVIVDGAFAAHASGTPQDLR